MEATLLTLLRCPIDPTREASLARQEQELICSGCAVRFPVKQGLPILVPDEAELPPGTREISQLPCRRAMERAKRGK